MPRVGCKLKGKHLADSMIVQTIKVASYVDKREVVAWLKEHGHKARLELDGNWWHARQLDPTCFRKETFRTIHFAHDIQVVVGKLKR